MHNFTQYFSPIAWMRTYSMKRAAKTAVETGMSLQEFLESQQAMMNKPYFQYIEGGRIEIGKDGQIKPDYNITECQQVLPLAEDNRPKTVQGCRDLIAQVCGPNKGQALKFHAELDKIEDQIAKAKSAYQEAVTKHTQAQQHVLEVTNEVRPVLQAAPISKRNSERPARTHRKKILTKRVIVGSLVCLEAWQIAQAMGDFIGVSPTRVSSWYADPIGVIGAWAFSIAVSLCLLILCGKLVEQSSHLYQSTTFKECLPRLGTTLLLAVGVFLAAYSIAEIRDIYGQGNNITQFLTEMTNHTDMVDVGHATLIFTLLCPLAAAMVENDNKQLVLADAEEMQKRRDYDRNFHIKQKELNQSRDEATAKGDSAKVLFLQAQEQKNQKQYQLDLLQASLERLISQLIKAQGQPLSIVRKRMEKERRKCHAYVAKQTLAFEQLKLHYLKYSKNQNSSVSRNEQIELQQTSLSMNNNHHIKVGS